MNSRTVLPGTKRPAKPTSVFPVGTLVALKTCRGVGKVTGMKRGRILVSWGIGYLGRHRAENLVLVEEK
jgi:hypothetical protein